MKLGVKCLNCLKCGVHVEEGEAFCPDCLRLMKEQPVPQDTVLVLPHRTDNGYRKISGKKRGQTTEEKLDATRQQLYKCRILAAVLTVLVLILSGTCVFLKIHPQGPALGQNYSTTGTTSPTETLPLE